MKILFVCTGNICRSPMAEALLRSELEARGCPDIEVCSRGTWAGDGAAATDVAIAVLAERGIDLRGHRSGALTVEDLGAADLVVVMTSVHVGEVTSASPADAGRVRLLKELAEIRTAPGERRPGSLAELLEGARPAPRRTLDVDDPMGLPRSAYDRCAADLESGITALAGILCGPRPGS